MSSTTNPSVNQVLSPSPYPYETGMEVQALWEIPVHKVAECDVDYFPPGKVVIITEVGDNASSPGRERTTAQIPVSDRKYKVKGMIKIQKQILEDIQFDFVPHDSLVPNAEGTLHTINTVTKAKVLIETKRGHNIYAIRRGEEVMVVTMPMTKSGKNVSRHWPLTSVFYGVRKVRRVVEPQTFRGRIWVPHHCLALKAT